MQSWSSTHSTAMFGGLGGDEKDSVRLYLQDKNVGL
jgi:hypothetical protein